MNAQPGMFPTRGHPSQARTRAGRPAPQPQLSSVLVFDGYRGFDDDALTLLERRGLQVVRCNDSGALLEQLVEHEPAVVLFALRPGFAEDLGLLHLVRRAAPDVALILLASETSLDTQRVVQCVHPTYYAVWPIDALELRDAVSDALERGRHGGAPRS